MKKEIKKDIENKIRILKPKLSDQSLKTYAQILFTLFYDLHSIDEPFDESIFEQQLNIVKYLEKYPSKTRKTYLSALIAISSKNDIYKKLMIKDIESINDIINKNEKSDQQIKTWVNIDEIKKVYNKLNNKVKFIFENIDDKLTIKEFQIFQDLIIISLVTGIFIPPRRSLDYTEFKIKNIDDKIDNYLLNDTLIFNRYKTKKYYGEQQIKIKDDLLNLLKLYISINPYEYLLVNNKGDKLSEITLNQKLKKLFNGKSGINIFRHVYISNLYKNTPNIKEIANQMGHNLDTAIQYIKK
jgi:integrase